MSETFNAESSGAPDAVRSMFMDQLGCHGDRLAAIDDSGSSVTYTELASRAHELAQVIGAERRLILLEATNSVEWLVAYIGALQGRHAILMSPAGDATVRQALEAQFRPALRLTAQGGYLPEPLKGRESPSLHPDLALLLSTSGSTGSIKLVRLSRNNVASNAASISQYLQLGRSERGAVNLPTHYSYGLSIVNSHLHVGATILLTNRSIIDLQFWEFLRTHHATSFAGVPHVYDLLGRIDFVGNAPSSLRYFTQAGGRLPPETASTFAKIADRNGWRFFIMYGQTEATARIAYLPPEQALDHPDCVGVPVPDGLIGLVDEAGVAIIEKETDGELVYRGPNVMMGYATTADELASGPELDRLVTGDLARLTEAGLYKITGRRSRFVKMLGNRVGLDDVETLLSSQGHHAIATGIDDQLLVVSRDVEAIPTISSLIAKRLKLPAGYITVRSVEQYPLLPSGKFDYAALKASLKPFGESGSAPTTADSTAAVVAAFASVFGEAAHDQSQSFVSLGGDSLNYVLVVLALEQVIPKLPLNWERMPITALAALPSEQRLVHGLSTIESGVLLRTLAIVAVVFGHSGIGPAGGSGVLMLLVGYNMVRFRVPAMLAGRIWSNVWDFLRKLLIPYALLNLLYMAEQQHFTLSGLTATSNFWGPQASPSLFPQWFIEVAAQCVLAIGALLSISSVRGAIMRAPFKALFALLGLAILVRFSGRFLWNTDALYNRVPWMYLPRFFIAWLILLAHDSRQRLAISAVALAYYVLMGLVDGPNSLSALIALSAATLVLLWLPRLPIPRLLHGSASVPAAAVFYIYMLHEIFMHIPRSVLHWKNGAALFAFGMIGPILTWWIVERLGLSRWMIEQIRGATAFMSNGARLKRACAHSIPSERKTDDRRTDDDGNVRFPPNAEAGVFKT